MKRGWLLVLLLAMLMPARADEVLFLTDPPNLQVWLVRPEAIYYLPRLPDGRVRLETGHPMVVVQFGYGSPTPDTYNVNVAEATRAQVWPPDRRPIPVKLSPGARLQYEVRERLFWYEMAGLLLLAVLGLDRLWLAPRRRRLHAEAARGRSLDELRATLDDSDPMLLTTLAGYRLTGRLGSGGMATVYRGQKEGGDTEAVAVKVIHRDCAADPEFRQRFEREVVVCRRLSHPRIVRILDAGDQDGILYMAMELVDGQSLRNLVRPGGLEPARVLELMDPVLAALAFAHQQGVVHRDLKPDNILLTSSGKAILMDFGLARRSDFQTVTVTGTVLGTPAYMAPEQIRGEATEAPADQYSMGVVLYELLAGQLPFPGTTDPIQLIVKHLQDEPLPLLEVRPELPPGLGAAIMRMLAKAPAERFADIAAVRQALSAYLPAQNA